MLLNLIKFELKAHFKQSSYVLFTALFFLSGIYLGIQEGAVDPENNYNIHLFSCLISLGAVFLIAFQSAYTVLRDKTNNSEQLIYATSVNKFQFLFSRFLGVLLASSFSTLLYILGLFFSILMDPLEIYNGVSPEIITFIWPWFIIVFPNVFVLTSLLFTVALFSKKVPFIFFVAVLVFIIFWVNNFYIGSPFTGGKLVVDEQTVEKVVLFDVLGLCSSYEQTQFWSPLEKTTNHVQFSGTLALNRIIWGTLGALCMLMSYLSFSFRLSPIKRATAKRFKFLQHKKRTHQQRISADYHPVFIIKNSIKARVKEFLTLVIIDLKTTVFNRTFMLLCLVWIGMLLSAILHHVSGQGVYGNLLPTTGLLVGLILEPLTYIGLFLVVFYAGELVWKSRKNNFDELLDASPTLNSILLLSKHTALFLLPVIIIVIGIFTALFVQISFGYTAIDFKLYLSVFYLGGSSLLIYGIFSIFIQQLVGNRYVGMLLSLMGIYVLGYVLPTLGYQSPLCSIFQLPKIGEGHSEFIGFGQQLHFFNWMSFLWISLAFIILLISFKIYKRTSEGRLHDQLKFIFKSWNKSQRLLLVILIGFVCTSSLVIHRKSNLSELSSDLDFREGYEKSFAMYKDHPIPSVTSVITKVLLQPEKMNYAVEGNYTIRNHTKNPIDTVLVTARVKLDEFSIEGAKVITESIGLADVKLLVFEPALLPDERAQMQFKLQKSIGDFELQNDLVSNGTYLQHSSFEPRFGYRKPLEITQKSERKKRGLLSKDQNRSFVNFKFSRVKRPKRDFETWVTTDKGQIPIAPGNFIDQFTTDSTVTYHFKSDKKTDNNLSYFSSVYEKTVEEYQGVSVEIYYLPQHKRNVNQIIKAAKATIDYGASNFGDYPFDHLRIAEVPLHWKFGGHALPGTIALQERFFTQGISDSSNGINQLSRVVIHEIGHQWFGHKMSPLPLKGGQMLNETMANYMEAQVLEKIYGKVMVRRLSNFSRRRYFNFRSSAELEEPPLHLVENETYISYRKGFLVMQSLKELLGETTLNESLKELIDANMEQESARSIDFVNLILTKVDSTDQHLIIDWFKKRVFYDLALTHVKYSQLENKKFNLEIGISANRFETNLNGEKNKIQTDENFTIGFYDKNPDDMNAAPIFKVVRLISGLNNIEVDLDSLPKYVIIDPMITRLDEDISNNVFEIECD